MPLSPEEQQEMAQLEAEVGHTIAHPGLSPEEHNEMIELEREIGQLTPQATAAAVPQHLRVAGGGQDIPSSEELKAQSRHGLKMAGMGIGDVLAGPPGAAAGAAIGEGVNQGIGALSGENVTPESAAEEIAKAGGEGYLTAITGSKILGPTLSWAGAKIAKGVSYIPGIEATSQAIKAYAQRAQEVLGMSKSADGNTAAAADQIKEQLMRDKTQFHNEMSTAVDDALAKRSGQAINMNDTKKAIDDGLVTLSNKKGISDAAREAATKDLVSLRADLEGLADENGNISLLDANKFKQDLQNRAFEGEGHILNQGAARNAQAVLRSQLNKAAPEIAPFNEQQAAVFELTDRMNKGLIKPGTQENSLLAAGSGKNPRNVQDLTDLDKLLGTDMVRKSQNLSAMKAFAPAGPGLEGPSLANSIAAPVIQGGASLGRAISQPGGTSLGASVIHGNQGVSDINRQAGP